MKWNQAVSEEYEFLVNVRNIRNVQALYRDFRFRDINNQWTIINVPKAEVPFLNYKTSQYYTIPKLYGLMDQKSMSASGIAEVQNRGNLRLSGKDVLIGFVDTGIDYRHKAFLDENGNSRIARMWIQDDNRIYTKEDINLAINDSQRYLEREESVPKGDEENGHGTFVAGIAAGSLNEETGFVGAAPGAELLVVKLKKAPQYLKDFFLVPPQAMAYSESDIMLGIRYLVETAEKLGRPLVICLGIGSSYGPHTSGSPLGQYLNQIAELPRIAVVVANGNEGNSRGHIGRIISKDETDVVELQVGAGVDGFVLELWTQYPGYVSIRIGAPAGETTGSLGIGRYGYDEIDFIYENTRLEIDYDLVETLSGSQLISVKFVRPTAGIWRIMVHNEYGITEQYNMWLPIQSFLSGEVYFLNSSVVTTLTQPASAGNVISVSAYDYRTKGVWIDSSRGYSANDTVKPEVSAPGVDVLGPIASPLSASEQNQYRLRSGSSVAAAHAAGAAALLMEWRGRQSQEVVFNTSDIKSLMILGAQRGKDRNYPNPEFGYGQLDLSRVFDILAGVVLD